MEKSGIMCPNCDVEMHLVDQVTLGVPWYARKVRQCPECLYWEPHTDLGDGTNNPDGSDAMVEGAR